MRCIKRILAGFTVVVVVAASGAAYQWIATRRDLAATPPPGRLIDIGGYRLHIWCMGGGQPTVILDSGLGGGAFAWPRVQPTVATSTQVCAYDRAGLGYSDVSPAPRTSEQIALELAKLIQNAGIEGKIVLIGASSGGFNTRIFATRYPDRVAGLVLVDASHEKQNERYAAVGLAQTIPASLRFVVTMARFGLLRLRRQTLGLQLEDVDPSVQPFLRATAYRSSRYQATYDELIHWEESAQQVSASRRKLDIPLVVITAGANAGPGEEIHRELQQDLLALSSRSCQIVAAQSGHEIFHDQPEAVVDAIRSVIAAAKNQKSPRC